MTSAVPPADPDPDLPSQKVLALGHALEQHGIPYAFGGAIALFYYRDPRSTIDIDVNVFLPPERQADVVDVLATLYAVDAAQVASQVRAAGQARSAWDATYVDLFFSDTEFHDVMARRVRRQPFLDGEINILSAEDLLVCKLLFDRAKDWVDVDAVVKALGGELDRSYVEAALALFVEPSDARFERWRATLPDE